MKFVETPRGVKNKRKVEPQKSHFALTKSLGMMLVEHKAGSDNYLHGEVMGVSPLHQTIEICFLEGAFHQLQHGSVEASCTDTMYNVYIYNIMTGFQVLGCFSCKHPTFFRPKMLLTSPGQDGAIVLHCCKGICIHMQLRDTFLQLAFN